MLRPGLRTTMKMGRQGVVMAVLMLASCGAAAALRVRTLKAATAGLTGTIRQRVLLLRSAEQRSLSVCT